jgi:hypothetical protein
MKLTRYLLLWVAAALGSLPLQAQHNRPWTVGAETSLLGGHLSAGSAYTTHFNSKAINVNYRLFRWLSLRSQTAWTNVHRYDSRSISRIYENEEQMGTPAHTTANVLALSVGVELAYRVGGGDLAWSTRYGANVQWVNTAVGWSNGEVFHVGFKPTIHQLVATRLDYTYWVHPDFGIVLGIEAGGMNGMNTTGSQQAAVIRTALPAGLETVPLAYIRPNHISTYESLILGITYRL